MQTAQEIIEHYTYNIKQAHSTEEKAQAKAVWDKVYDELPNHTKTEVKALLKQKAVATLNDQQNLDSRILAVGFPSFELFFEQTAMAH